MQSQLSIFQLIWHASFFVQLIMFILLAMFFITLFISGKKWVQFQRLRYKIRRFNSAFWSDTELQKLYLHYQANDSETIESIFESGFREFRQFRGSHMNEPNMIVSNCRRAMEAAEERVLSNQDKHLNVLATFASSAPYIGLLGTVYGIMSSFISLSGTHQSSISSVAPGIAEALVATAFGLLAAIPSVLSYNYFTSESNHLCVEYDAFIEEFSNLLQRQILAAHDHAKSH